MGIIVKLLMPFSQYPVSWFSLVSSLLLHSYAVTELCSLFIRQNLHFPIILKKFEAMIYTVQTFSFKLEWFTPENAWLRKKRRLKSFLQHTAWCIVLTTSFFFFCLQVSLGNSKACDPQCSSRVSHISHQHFWKSNAWHPDEGDRRHNS